MVCSRVCLRTCVCACVRERARICIYIHVYMWISGYVTVSTESVTSPKSSISKNSDFSVFRGPKKFKVEFEFVPRILRI